MNWNKIEEEFKKTFKPDSNEMLMFYWIMCKVKNPEVIEWVAPLTEEEINEFHTSTITHTEINYYR